MVLIALCCLPNVKCQILQAYSGREQINVGSVILKMSLENNTLVKFVRQGNISELTKVSREVCENKISTNTCKMFQIVHC